MFWYYEINIFVCPVVESFFHKLSSGKEQCSDLDLRLRPETLAFAGYHKKITVSKNSTKALWLFWFADENDKTYSRENEFQRPNILRTKWTVQSRSLNIVHLIRPHYKAMGLNLKDLALGWLDCNTYIMICSSVVYIEKEL